MFLQIPEFPDYLINDQGVIISTKRGKFRTHNQFVEKRGYHQVVVYKNNKNYTRMVHTLVTQTFLGWRPAGLEVNHKDGNKSNNHLSNLEYVTPSENIRHAWATGLFEKVREATIRDKTGERNKVSKLSDEQVDKLQALKGTMLQREAAALFGISPKHVSSIWGGKRRVRSAYRG